MIFVGPNEQRTPNWGMRFYGKDLRYDRLSIGYDNGEKLYIPLASRTEKMDWAISPEVYSAYHMTEDNDQFKLDGNNDESFWKNNKHIRIYYLVQNVYLEAVCRDGDIWIAYDDNYLYVFLAPSDETYESGDFTMFALSTNKDMTTDPYGMDIVFIDPRCYVDMSLDPFMSEPAPDTDNGGTNNGEGCVVYINGKRNIEFRKELNSGDINSADLSVDDFNSYVYITILAGYESDTTPNYAEVKEDVNGTPYIQTHPIAFQKAYDTSGTKTSRNNNLLIFVHR
mgnify:CR=1 FL=1